MSALKVLEDDVCSSQCQALTIAIFPQNEPLITRACLMCPYMPAHYSALNQESYQCLHGKFYCSYGNAFVNRRGPRGSSPVCGGIFQRERASCRARVSVPSPPPFSSAWCRRTASCTRSPAAVLGVGGCSALGGCRRNEDGLVLGDAPEQRQEEK